MSRSAPYPKLPDVRDGLTRLERVILYELSRAQAELGGNRRVASAMLYGRVVEHLPVSVQEFQAVLQRLVSSPAHRSALRSRAEPLASMDTEPVVEAEAFVGARRHEQKS